MRYSAVVSFIAIVAVTLGVIGCSYGQKAITAYEKTKPRVERAFALYFGQDSGGNYLIEADTQATGRASGFQDTVYSNWQTFSDTEQRDLAGYNKELVELYRDAEKMDKKFSEMKEKGKIAWDKIIKFLAITGRTYGRISG